MKTIDPRKHANVHKPLVRAGALYRMLLHSVDHRCPEVKLVVAVIAQAIEDCASTEYFDQVSAERFMRDWRLEAWAKAVGLDPDFVREVVIKTQFLSPIGPTPPAPAPTVSANQVKAEDEHLARSSDA